LLFSERRILFGDAPRRPRYQRCMGTLLRLFGNSRARDFAGWSLEATTRVLVTIHIDDAFGGTTQELDPMSPSEAAVAVERMTQAGLRLSVTSEQRYVPFRELRNTVAYVDDVSPAELRRITAEMIRSGVPVIQADLAASI
jgi:hypothetical protein